jgi:hypothetical protein
MTGSVQPPHPCLMTNVEAGHPLGTKEPIIGSFVSVARREPSMTEDTEIAWHKEQIVKNQTILEELEAGNTAGGELFPETQSEIEHLKAQIAQSELIVAAGSKDRPEVL